MTRILLACSLSTFALNAYGASIMNGGGAASQKFDYAAPDVNGTHVAEEPLFNSLSTKAQFGTYWATTSLVAQTGLLNNDLTCLIDYVTGANGGQCSNMPGGANTVYYAISETAIGSTTATAWFSATYGQQAAGNLIQIPAMGTGLAIVFNDTNITTNGAATLSDGDLCGIFSGLITDFSQITDSATTPASGQFKLVYRSDSAGTTYSLTNHLAAVCSASNTAPGVTFTATSTFATLFGSPITNQIPNALAVTSLTNMANELAGLLSGPLPQAIGYISPDWTSVDSATSSAKLSNGQPSPLIVAGLVNAGHAYVPTAANIKTALEHPKLGVHLTPPTNATDAAVPLNWVPVIQTTSTGYPIVSYSSIVLPQCYADPKIKAGMIAFLKDHYNNAQFLQIQANNGLVPVANGPADRFLAAIKSNILNNKNGWNTNIGNKSVCASLAGR